MEPLKPEEITHPPMDQLQGLEYCIDSNPSWGNFLDIPSTFFLINFIFFLIKELID